MDATQKPWSVGMVRGPDSMRQETIQRHTARISAAATLGDLDHYRWYSPALLYLYVRLYDRDPMVDFCGEQGREIFPVALNFEKPVFSGLERDGDHRWNHHLIGLEPEDFAAYVAFLGTLTIVDREHGHVVRVRTKEISIPDPLFLQHQVSLPEEVPMVTVTVFALDTNHGCWYITEAANLLEPAAARYTKQSYEETEIFSNALLGEKLNPYGELEQRLTKDGLSIAETEIRQRVDDARRNEQVNGRGTS